MPEGAGSYNPIHRGKVSVADGEPVSEDIFPPVTAPSFHLGHAFFVGNPFQIIPWKLTILYHINLIQPGIRNPTHTIVTVM